MGRVVSFSIRCPIVIARQMVRPIVEVGTWCSNLRISLKACSISDHRWSMETIRLCNLVVTLKAIPRKDSTTLINNRLLLNTPSAATPNSSNSNTTHRPSKFVTIKAVIIWVAQVKELVALQRFWRISMVIVTIALHHETQADLEKAIAPVKAIKLWVLHPAWIKARVTARTQDLLCPKYTTLMCLTTVKSVAAIKGNLHMLIINLARLRETMEVQAHQLFQHLWYQTIWQASCLRSRIVKSTQTTDQESRLTLPTRTEKAASLKSTQPLLPITTLALTIMLLRLHHWCRKIMAWAQATQLLGQNNSF